MDFEFLLFIAWCAIGFWGWWILYKKIAVTRINRAMLILMFVFLVPLGVATLLAAVMVPKQKECRECGSAILDKARKCPHCHSAQ